MGFEHLEQSTLNLNFKIRGKSDPHKSILNFTINDDEFFSYMTQKNRKRQLSLPYNKDYSKNLLFWDSKFFITLLQKISKYEPRLIAIVPVFPEDTIGKLTPNQKKILKKLSSNTPVFWSSSKDEDKIISPPEFLTNNKIHLNNLIASSDLFIKKAKLKGTLAGSIIDHIKQFDKFKQISTPKPSEEFFINYTSFENTFETMSSISFLTQPDTGWAPLIKDKIVIIDIQTDSQNKFMIPFPENNRSILVSNGRIQNEILSSVLNETTIYRFPPSANTVIAILLGFATSILFVRFKATYALTIVMTISATYLLLALLFFGSLSIWVNTVTPLISILVTTLLMATWRFTSDERKKTYAMQQEIEKLKGNFLSLISHNLRTPIAKIRALSSVLLNRESDNLKEEQLKDIKDILKSSKDLTAYITNILNITRIESQRVKLNKSICDINVIIEHAVQRIQEMNDGKKITFDLKLEPIFSIELDKELFLQLFINILSNAINYSPSNSTITVESLEKNNLLYISVTDQGIGISKDDINNIFNKFYRAKNVYTESNTGTGLGLYLVQYFLKLHGGTIKADSVLGEGTTFTITLPIS
jgi:signal transduction histidine kinase